MAKPRIPKEIAFERVGNKYGDRYDLNKFDYLNMKAKSIVLCKECGNEFNSSITSLLQGHGCPKCKFIKLHILFSKTQEQFEDEMKSEWGNKFTVIGEYKGNKTPIKVKCNDCGFEYEAIPTNILSKHEGCPKCSNRLLKDTNSFMKKLFDKFGDVFEAVTEYVSSDTNITLKCKKCGELITNKPHKFLQGQGCKRCKGFNILKSEDFYRIAKEKWGNKFSYLNDYKNQKTPITFICPKHGKVSMYPKPHLDSEYGCPKCAEEGKTAKSRNDLGNLINKFVKTYGDLYDYSKYEYKGMCFPSTIICKKCGNEFQMDFNHHMRGQGCPICSSSHLENEVANLLKSNHIDFIQHCNSTKLGWLNKKHFDFYLPTYNIAIECQGRQHFESDKFFGGVGGFFKQLQNDREKFKVSSENGIKLIYYTNISFDINKLPFYKDKIIFKNIKDLKNYINCYEASN